MWPLILLLKAERFFFMFFSIPHLEFGNLCSAEYLMSQLQFVVWILLFVVYIYNSSVHIACPYYVSWRGRIWRAVVCLFVVIYICSLIIYFNCLLLLMFVTFLLLVMSLVRWRGWMRRLVICLFVVISVC